jgi:hypothetical protein
VTEALTRTLQISDAKTISVTIVPIVPEGQILVKQGGASDPLKFESVSLLTYEGPRVSHRRPTAYSPTRKSRRHVPAPDSRH